MRTHQLIWGALFMTGAASFVSAAHPTHPFGPWQDRHSSPWMLNGTAFGNGTFVAVGPFLSWGPAVAYASTNGLAWTRYTATKAAKLHGVAYGAERFVAVGTGPGDDVTLVSRDGFEWSEHVNSLIGGFEAIAYGHGLFVTSGFGVYSSPDGIAWTPSRIDSRFRLNSLAFGGGKFVAGGNGAVFLSTNGVDWSEFKRLGGDDITALAFGDGMFVGADSNSKTWRSTDGEQWRSQTLPGPSVRLTGLGFGNGLFALSGQTFSGGTNRFYSSPNGTSWTFRESPLSQARGTISYGQGLFVASGKGLATSNDGTNWNAVNLPDGFGVSFRDVTNWRNGLVAVGFDADSALAARSPDGLDWEVHRIKSKHPLHGIAASGDLLAAVGGQSPTLENPQPTAAILSSSDGISWTERIVESALPFNSVVHAKNLFVAVGRAGTIYTSSDGVNWTKRPSGTTEDLVAIRFGHGRFTAVGGNESGRQYYTRSEIVTSTDGIHWTRANFPAGNILLGLAFGNGTFLAARWFGPYLTSTNGVDWVAHDLGRAPAQGALASYTTVSGAGYVGGWFFIDAGGFHPAWVSSDLLSWSPVGVPSTKWVSLGRRVISATEFRIAQSELTAVPYTVSITSQPLVSESGDIGGFSIRRTGPRNLPLEVRISMRGTAINGQDYETVPTTITIAAGSDTAEIPIRPRADTLAEETESVVAHIEPGDNYDVRGEAAATVWIADAGHLPRLRPSQILRSADGSVDLVLETPMAGQYVIERSSDLKTWETVQTVQSTEPVARIKDAAAGEARGFYRAKQVPPNKP